MFVIDRWFNLAQMKQSVTLYVDEAGFFGYNSYKQKAFQPKGEYLLISDRPR